MAGGSNSIPMFDVVEEWVEEAEEGSMGEQEEEEEEELVANVEAVR